MGVIEMSVVVIVKNLVRFTDCLEFYFCGGSFAFRYFVRVA